jgi:hypothetical protein
MPRRPRRDVPDADLPVFGPIGLTPDLRDQLRLGPVTVTRNLLGATASGVASLASRYGPGRAGDDHVVVLEEMDDDEPLSGWMPGDNEEGVA